MLIGAEMTMRTGFDTARAGLAGLAGNGWLMSADDHVLVMVVFGGVASGPSQVMLSVRWEPVAPGSGFPDLMDGDITLAPGVGPGPGARLSLSGACQLPPGTVPGRYGPAQLQAVEAARGFMTRVAAIVDVPVDRAADRTSEPPGSPPRDAGPLAWS